MSSGIPAPEPPAPRFLQPHDEHRSRRLAGVFQPAGTPRVRSSECDHELIRACFQGRYFFVVYRLSGSPSWCYARPHREPPPHPYAQGCHTTGLLIRCRIGFPLRLCPTLKFWSQPAAPWPYPQFHPWIAGATLMTFAPSGYPLVLPGRCQPSQGSSFTGFAEQHG